PLAPDIAGVPPPVFAGGVLSAHPAKYAPIPTRAINANNFFISMLLNVKPELDPRSITCGRSLLPTQGTRRHFIRCAWPRIYSAKIRPAKRAGYACPSRIARSIRELAF